MLTAVLATLLHLILWCQRSLPYRNHMVGTYVKPIYIDKQEDQTNSNFTGYLHGSYSSWQFLTSPCLHIVPKAQRSFTRMLSRTGLKIKITRTIITKTRSLEHNEGEFALSLYVYEADIGSFLQIWRTFWNAGKTSINFIMFWDYGPGTSLKFRNIEVCSLKMILLVLISANFTSVVENQNWNFHFKVKYSRKMIPQKNQLIKNQLKTK